MSSDVRAALEAIKAAMADERRLTGALDQTGMVLTEDLRAARLAIGCAERLGLRPMSA
ncbi:hypothetical protein ACFOYU_06105 [Microvirga sp. GCM10011540]|uniref:hypothetical protein n=1 Tax=Microvirga sp. GCM10011540 TaxID=3317338 RepID=UPI003612FC8C